jgi:hypothetical protein
MPFSAEIMEVTTDSEKISSILRIFGKTGIKPDYKDWNNTQSFNVHILSHTLRAYRK